MICFLYSPITPATYSTIRYPRPTYPPTYLTGVMVLAPRSRLVLRASSVAERNQWLLALQINKQNFNPIKHNEIDNDLLSNSDKSNDKFFDKNKNNSNDINNINNNNPRDFEYENLKIDVGSSGDYRNKGIGNRKNSSKLLGVNPMAR